MRIGLFTDTYTPDINGVVSSIVTLQMELEKNGHEVFIITNRKALLSLQREGNVLRLPGLELKWLYGYKLSTPYHFSAQEEIKKMNLDVIHMHTEFGVGMFARIVAKYLNIPVVSTYHTMYEDYMHYINRLDIEEIERMGKKVAGTLSRTISDSVQAVIAPSDKTKKTLLSYGVHRPIYIIPTGLNFDAFAEENIDMQKVEDIKKEYGIQSDDRIIIFVGRIAQEKSIDIVIKGFQFIEDRHIKLMIVGGGPQLDELKDLAKQYHLEDRIIFTDKKKREEVPLYYACSDAFVSASITETQGMTFIEALASGLPLFARPDKVLDDLVLENQTGYLFEDSEQFAQKVCDYFAKDETFKLSLRQNAKETVKKYDSDIFYNKVMAVYYQAIDDFEDAYQVLKVKTLDDYVRITIENEKEDQPLKIMIRIDDYFLYKIRKDMLLDRTTVQELQYKERQLEAYRSCIRKLRIKDYTTKEIENYIRIKTDLDAKEIDDIIDELKHKGYVNDRRYMIDKIEKAQDSMQGKGKIIRSLTSKGIPYDDILELLDKIDDEEETQKAMHMAEKIKNTITGKSKMMARQTIMRRLIVNGFDSGVAKNISDRIALDEIEEDEILNKVISKAYKNYAKKFSGYQLKNKIMVYCMGKGFDSSSVLKRLNEMEWKDEEID